MRGHEREFGSVSGPHWARNISKTGYVAALHVDWSSTLARRELSKNVRRGAIVPLGHPHNAKYVAFLRNF